MSECLNKYCLKSSKCSSVLGLTRCAGIRAQRFDFIRWLAGVIAQHIRFVQGQPVCAIAHFSFVQCCVAGMEAQLFAQRLAGLEAQH